ncbi:MAG TPA: hotdog fold thioesterase [Spirochaetia bacterium]|nr:hotdog fold thioesterase [Spirochaetia bacterium]
MAGLEGLPAELEKAFRASAFPRHVGVELVEVRPGYAAARLPVAGHMTNVHGITHGGAVFTLADVVLEAASNSHGQAAVALNVNINFLKATGAGDCLTATATEENLTRRTGLYRIRVEDGSGALVAEATGMVYRKGDKVPGG